MKKLSRDSFNQAIETIEEKIRPLERKIFFNYFEGRYDKELLNELSKFQNDDGGFGKGIEKDFKLELSSPMATSFAFQTLIQLDHLEEAEEIIKAGIKYFEDTYCLERKGWFAVPKEVNDYPHAPWWHFNEDEGMTVIDYSWGNPSAEIIGYLYKYQEYLTELDPEELVRYAINYWNDKTVFQSEHETYCVIRLYNILPERYRVELEDQIEEAVKQLLNKDPKEWRIDYVPKPLDFVSEPANNKFGISQKMIDENLEMYVDLLEEENQIEPTWEWGQYEETWKKARKHWLGWLTVRALITLDKFDRIEDE